MKTTEKRFKDITRSVNSIAIEIDWLKGLITNLEKELKDD
jgi:hypothetical protein